MKGWNKSEESQNIDAVVDPWLKGYFHASHDDWDQKTWRRNFSELRLRDQTLMCLGDVCGKKVLDIGCGDGTYAYVLSILGAIVSGQDLGVDAIRIANERVYGERNCNKGKFVCADASKLSFDDSYFDVVFSADFFEHIKLAEKRQVLGEVYRVLKPGGLFVIKTPNLDYLRLSIFFKRLLRLLRFRSPLVYIAHTRNNPDNEHHGLTNYREMRRELEDCFFHTPVFQHQPLVRRELSPIFTDILGALRLKIFSEHLILVTRKSIFVGIGND